MCGICGIYNYGTGEPAERGLVRSMTVSIVHRGPDDDGFHFDGSLGMGMRRLSIIDLAGGAQPIGNESGTIWTVYNGEIYNYRELRAELTTRGHVFKTASDTETIVHAYEEWGVDGLARLNGMFGLAIWDAPARRLVLARDPVGIKPLYYHDDGRTLRFGSELRSILRDPGVEACPDLEALNEALTFRYVPAPRTAFQGIHKLIPGYALVCDAEGSRGHRFFRAVPRRIVGRSEADLVEELRTRIETAVKRQMVADVPVGAMLSGGTDSSTVATIMRRTRGAPIETFTAGFEGEFAGNELQQAADLAARLGCPHHTAVMGSREFVETMAICVQHMEEPVATDSIIPYYKVCKLAASRVKVVLTGQGADEPFAGYPRYLGERYGHVYRALPAALRERCIVPLVAALPGNLRLKRAVRSLGDPDAARRLVRIYTTFDSNLTGRLYRDGLFPPAGRDMKQAVERWLADVPHLEGLNRMLYADTRLSLADDLLLYGDKIAMASSLEARVPFLDLDLLLFAEGLPAGMKIRGLTQKYLLKKAVAKWISPEIISRKKVGFETPVGRWFRHELFDWLSDLLLASDSACRQYFRPEMLRTILADHRSAREDHRPLLFSLVTFELWHQQFIRKRVEAPAAPGAGELGPVRSL